MEGDSYVTIAGVMPLIKINLIAKFTDVQRLQQDSDLTPLHRQLSAKNDEVSAGKIQACCA